MNLKIERRGNNAFDVTVDGDPRRKDGTPVEVKDVTYETAKYLVLDTLRAMSSV